MCALVQDKLWYIWCVLWYKTNCGIPGVCFGTRQTVVYLVCALVQDKLWYTWCVLWYKTNCGIYTWCVLWYKLSEDFSVGESLLCPPSGEEGEELALPEMKLQSATMMLELGSVYHGPPVRV